MQKHSDVTPCPAGRKHVLRTSFRDDVTEDLNCTTEFKAALRNAGPRRRTSIAPRRQNEATASHLTADLSRLSTEVEAHTGSTKPPKPRGLGLAPARRRVSQLLAQRIDQDFAESHAPASPVAKHDAPNMRKRPRRRTIYIPPDDTTVLTIHPGLQSDSTVRSHHLLKCEDQRDVKIRTQDYGRIRKSNAKRASLAAAPKRVPLQPTLRPLQETDDQQDRPTAGPGKENVPPGVVEEQNSKAQQDHISKARRVSIFQSILEDPSKPVKSDDRQMCRAGNERQSAAKAANTWISMRPPMPTQIAQPGLDRDRRASMMNWRNSLYYGTNWKAILETHQEQVLPPTRLITAAIPQESIKAKIRYQILEENIEKSEMFEDAWLSYQESAIQQLLNRLFETAHEKAPTFQFDRKDFRGKLLRLYQDSECALIFKRLHASLLYGALNPPKGSIADTARLKTDIGLRQKFMAIWLGTYDLEALMSAAEVVVGRNISLCPSSPHSSLPRNLQDLTKDRIRSTGLFIESCLLRNEDVHEQTDQSDPLWCWRRTMLRCMMMVLLLDKAKENGSLLKNLFQPLSRVKSSRDILAELLSLISPFLGDGTRPLAHLHYQVHHRQYPLSEYKYGIENLATDLRDGVQLTHLVELLLYPPEYLVNSREDITVAMPTGEVLVSSDQESPWPLSQHLKIPCFTSTQKIYNVQVALSALSDVRGVGSIVERIKAEDVVNGHRERTMTLLWGLVGKWGLETMVDFENVQVEIRRLSRRANYRETLGSETEDDPELAVDGLAKHTCLLKQWARIIAHQQGLRVSNLTTSFSDGRVFAAIVDEYRKYLPKGQSLQRPGTGQLEAKLKEIGCSDAFACIFAHNDEGRVFDRDFTVAALAFLYSRLLGASKRGMAAAVIVRAYRQRKVCQGVRQRCVLLKLAHDCKSVYITRNQVIGAARVLQRTWRVYLEQKRHGNTLSQRRAVIDRQRSDATQGKSKMSDDNIDIWLF